MSGREAYDPAMGGDVLPPPGRKMAPAAAARLVLSGSEDHWSLLAEDPAYDTRYGAAVRVLARHVLAPSGSAAIDPLLEEVIDARVAALAVAAGIDRDGMDWEEVLASATEKLAAVSSPATAATPEVVTEAEAARLPERSKFVACDEYGMPFGGATVNSIGGHRSPRSAGGHALILYRAPEPSKPLAVGDPVKSAQELEALPVGTIVEEYYGVVGQRRIDGVWQWTARGKTDEMRWPGVVRYLPETGGQS